jgi:AcrR family transcriptional regulator
MCSTNVQYDRANILTVGNKEKLLAGARICLYDKGYARTTARDVAAAAGVSLAAIGYHFGTTEALLSEALIEALKEWGDELEQVLAVDGALDPPARFVAIWDQVIASISANRPLWAVQFEALTLLDRVPQLRELFGGAQEGAQFGLVALFQGVDPEQDPLKTRRLGSLYQAMLTGVVAQHLTDPSQAPSGRDLFQALQAMAGGVIPRDGSERATTSDK